MTKVELSIGEYVVIEPPLPAWIDILSTVSQDDIDLISGAVVETMALPDEGASSSDLIKVGVSIIPMCLRIPGLGMALMKGCLRVTEGDKLIEMEDEVLDRATGTDLVTFLSVLFESGIFQPLLDELKNRLGPAIQRSRFAIVNETEGE